MSQVTLEKITETRYRAKVSATAEFVSKARKESIKKIKTEKTLPGFRKGKAPLSIVEKFYGEQATQDAIGSYVAKEFYKALEEEKIEPLGYPRFANTDYKLVWI